MVIGLASKEDAKVNSNSFDIALEALVEEGRYDRCVLVTSNVVMPSFMLDITYCIHIHIYIDVSTIRLCQVAGTVTFTESDAAVSI